MAVQIRKSKIWADSVRQPTPKPIPDPKPETPTFNVLSLFDGMSCGQLAMKKAGINVDNYFASEVDEHAIKVTMNNFPETIQMGDVRDLNSTNPIFGGDDTILIGGSPCQNFSFAGTNKGMTTKTEIEVTTLDQYLELKNDNFDFEGQSYLFWEYVRILRELKPKYFLLENVKMANKWKTLISDVMGVQPIQINSSLVSGQSRERLYWTNIPNVKQPDDRKILLRDVLQPDSDIDLAKFSLSEKAIDYMGRDRNGKPRWEYHHNHLDGKASCLTANMFKGVPYGVIKEYLRRLTPIECERLQCVPDNYTDCVSNTQRYRMIGNGWTIDVIAHILKGIK